MRYEKIICEKQDGIAIITLNDPNNRNTISGSLVEELAACLDSCSDDAETRVIVIRGAGGNFSAGGNINVMKERIDQGRHEEFRPGMRKLGAVASKIRTIRKPIIASIEGAAAGGGLSIALLCDFRVASADAKFIFAFVNIGLIPDCAGLLPLVKIVGAAKATELLMTARLFSGQEAFDMGLVNEAAPADQLEEATLKLARKLAQGPTLAYGRIKALINRTTFSDLELELDNEMEYQLLCAQTEDHKEGIDAFLEKRKPIFQGR